MINPTLLLPKEIWDLILNYCPDLNSLINLSKVNREIGGLALKKLKTIKNNAHELYDKLSKIQDLYTVKYKNIDGTNVNISNRTCSRVVEKLTVRFIKNSS